MPLSQKTNNVECYGIDQPRRTWSAARPATAEAAVAPGPPARRACRRSRSDARAVLVRHDDAGAVEPAALAAHRRVDPRAQRKLARRRRRALLLLVEGTEERGAAAPDPARRRRRRAATKRRPPGEGARAARRSGVAEEGSGRLLPPPPGRRRLARDGTARPRQAAGPPHHLSHRDRLSADRGVRRVVRPYAHLGGLLPGTLRAPGCTGTRPDGGPVRGAMAPARNVQQRLHLPRRQQRFVDRRPPVRAAPGWAGDHDRVP